MKVHFHYGKFIFISWYVCVWMEIHVPVYLHKHYAQNRHYQRHIPLYTENLRINFIDQI